MSTNPLPFDTLAAEINAHLRSTDRTQLKSNDHRLAAGLLLDEARRRVQAGEAGDVNWTQWQIANIHRSLGDVRKLIARATGSSPRVTEPRSIKQRPPATVPVRLPPAELIARTGNDNWTYQQIVLRENLLRGFARQIKAAADMVAATNRAAIRHPGWDRDQYDGLDAAIMTANTATEIMWEAVRSFIKMTSPHPFSADGFDKLPLEKQNRRALPPTVPNEVLSASLARKSAPAALSACRGRQQGAPS